MADPFAIIGLTASLVSFIDFSLKIVSTGKELYNSGRDTTRQLHELSSIVEDIRRKNQEFRKVQTNATRKLHNDEIQAIKLAAKSDKVAEELQKILEKLKTRPGYWKVTEAGRITIVSRKRKNEVDELRDRLLKLDERPGSGKSTLMKFACTQDVTTDALSEWAGSDTLHTASFFFWNQGFEMQKSKAGLLQSLLYQLLRRAPDSIPQMCYDHPVHESWQIKELEACFQHFTQSDDLKAKFCFFIDGLDEYGGDEEDLSQVLTSISQGPHVKLCVSCRHRPFLEDVFQQKAYSLDIQDFTKGDMIAHVRRRLKHNPKFKTLVDSEDLFREIVAKITEHAQGVWLWVYLVVRDLVSAVNRGEPRNWLEKIIEDFPPDLEGYFDQVIKNIKPRFRKDMVRIFLVTLEEVQPLPLYAFSLLEIEELDHRFAIEAEKFPLPESELEDVENSWKNRIINCCGDLLLVNPGEHPTFLRNPVDFMHRTVRDFLQDCYLPTLKQKLGDQKYSPMLSLCNMMLYLLKRLPKTDLSDPNLKKASVSRMIGLVDELLYYAHEDEKTETPSDLVEILDEVDRVNGLHAGKIRNHWSSARDPPRSRGMDEYREGGNYNFLALAVQARLVNYVEAKLLSDPSKMNKHGRPLLDYALRPRRMTPITMPYHSKRVDSSVDLKMIELLLSFGALPNQQVHLNDGRTVWALFLISIYETTNLGEKYTELEQAWYSACELLIQNGADLDCWLESNTGNTPLTAFNVLRKVFGPEKAAKLRKEAQSFQAKNVTASWFPRFWWS
ncbi:hypothetical protein LQW54_005858 [Pestalotiopsis sp. IQ-011]